MARMRFDKARFFAWGATYGEIPAGLRVMPRQPGPGAQRQAARLAAKAQSVTKPSASPPSRQRRRWLARRGLLPA